MIPARQSTAFETAIGPVLDADGVAVTGCVVGDFKIKKTSGAFAALNGSATLTHVSAGFYDLVLTTSDVDTVGLNCIAIDDTTNACAPLYLQVIEEAVYDALFAASATGYLQPTTGGRTLDVSAAGNAGIDWSNVEAPTTTLALTGTTIATTQKVDIETIKTNPVVNGGTITFPTGATLASTTNITAGTITTATNVTTVNGLAANVITAASLATDAGTELATAVWAFMTNAGPEGTPGTFADLFVNQHPDEFVIATQVWANAARTLTAATNITSTGGTVTVSSGSVSVYDFTTAAKALLQTEAEDAIVAHRLDELLNADSDIDGAAPPTVGSVFHELMSKTAGSFTFDQTTDSLEALRDRGDAEWITATGFSTHSASDVWAVGTRVLTAGTNIQLPSNGLANISAWSVAITGNLTGNVTGSVNSVTTAVAITSNIKKNQALAAFMFMMTDSTTHEPATGLTVAVTRSINGAAFAAGTLSSVTEVSNGMYSVDFGAGDLNGNVIILKATATGADITFERILTQP